MSFDKPIADIIRQRSSCRTYLRKPVDSDTLARLTDSLTSTRVGPLGNRTRFELVFATEGDSKALRGLGAYGFIKGATAFIVGAIRQDEKALEDFGYLMEWMVLKATDLGLGTCWLGGAFTKSRFARKISLLEGEFVPAVASLGYRASNPRWVDGKIRDAARSDQRLPWEKLFFDGRFDTPLSEDVAGEYARALEMVRLGPSASNRQPWRIVREGAVWHFYLRRTPGYRTSNYARMLKMADLQRIDMGIAMCHFELMARESGSMGGWRVSDPGIPLPDELAEYSVSWVG